VPGEGGPTSSGERASVLDSDQRVIRFGDSRKRIRGATVGAPVAFQTPSKTGVDDHRKAIGKRLEVCINLFQASP
jgi:hypothetical protein